MFESLEDLAARLSATGYFIDPVMTQVVFLAAKLQKPLILEGPAGSGKTQLAVSVAQAVGTHIERMQCYKGVTDKQAIGEFDDSLQRLYMEFSKEQGLSWQEIVKTLKGRDFFRPGPLMRALEPGSESGSESDGPSAPVTEGGVGQVLDAPLPDEGTPGIEEQAREWSVAVNQAVMLAKQASRVPAGIERTLEGVAEAAIDWRELLRRLWSETTPADYSWMRPNRRHIWAGLYLPGVIWEGVGEIAIAVDCSGSVKARQLRLFEAEVRSILEGQRPQRIYVLYFDVMVHKVETYEAGQRVALNPVGGGGTEFGPCFDWLDQHGIVPQTLVFLTDLWGTFPTSAPSYPVLWASTGRRQAPFGEVIPLHAA